MSDGFMMDLPCPIEREQWTELSEELGRLQTEVNGTERAKREANERFNAKIKRCRARMAELGPPVATHHVEKMVAVKLVRDLARRQIVTIRLDTEDVVHVRDMTDREAGQGELAFDEASTLEDLLGRAEAKIGGLEGFAASPQARVLEAFRGELEAGDDVEPRERKLFRWFKSRVPDHEEVVEVELVEQREDENATVVERGTTGPEFVVPVADLERITAEADDESDPAEEADDHG